MCYVDSQYEGLEEDQENAREAIEEDQRRAAEEQARLAAEEEARWVAEEEARCAAAEEEARRVAEEEARRAEEEARLAAEEAARKAAEEEAKRIAQARRAAAAEAKKQMNKYEDMSEDLNRIINAIEKKINRVEQGIEIINNELTGHRDSASGIFERNSYFACGRLKYVEDQLIKNFVNDLEKIRDKSIEVKNQYNYWGDQYYRNI